MLANVLRVRVQKGKADRMNYNLSSMPLMASQLASSSPLCRLDSGVLLSNVAFVRSSLGRAFVMLSCAMLTPLSALAGCTGFSPAATFNVAERNWIETLSIDGLVATVVNWVEGVVDGLCEEAGDVVAL